MYRAIGDTSGSFISFIFSDLLILNNPYKERKKIDFFTWTHAKKKSRNMSRD